MPRPTFHPPAATPQHDLEPQPEQRSEKDTFLNVFAAQLSQSVQQQSEEESYDAYAAQLLRPVKQNEEDTYDPFAVSETTEQQDKEGGSHEAPTLPPLPPAYDPFDIMMEEVKQEKEKVLEQPPPPPPNDDALDTLAAAELEMEKEREDHARRVAAENSKKRKFGSGGAARRMKFTPIVVKTAAAAFGGDSDDESSTPAAAEATASVPDDMRITIKGAAEWIASHQTHEVAALLERSKGDERLSFLQDEIGATPSGRLYLECLATAKAKSDVQKITSGQLDPPFKLMRSVSVAQYQDDEEDAVALAAAAELAAQQAAARKIAEEQAEKERKIAEEQAERERKIAEQEAELIRRRAEEVAEAAAKVVAEVIVENGGERTARRSRWVEKEEERIAKEEAAVRKLAEEQAEAAARRAEEVAEAAAKVVAEVVGVDAGERTARRSRWGKKLVEGSSVPVASSDVPVSTPYGMGAATAVGVTRPAVEEVVRPPSLPPGLASNKNSGKSRDANSQGLALPETMDAASAKQLREQQELQRMEAKIREAARMQQFKAAPLPAGAKLKELHDERLKEYSELAANADEDFRDTVEMADASGGVIEGGTWEHRKRAQEMLATADGALALTAAARGIGSTHLGQFLPKEEMERFAKKANAAVEGTALEPEEDFEKNRLDSSNIGYQLLQRAGWKEGQGLGAESGGTSAPVNMATLSATNSGVGVHTSHEVEGDDNEFDQYRKRMMLAYKFRPNPLNNPRRAYY